MGKYRVPDDYEFAGWILSLIHEVDANDDYDCVINSIVLASDKNHRVVRGSVEWKCIVEDLEASHDWEDFIQRSEDDHIEAAQSPDEDTEDWGDEDPLSSREDLND